jgi:hypothetical protein
MKLTTDTSEADFASVRLGKVPDGGAAGYFYGCGIPGRHSLREPGAGDLPGEPVFALWREGADPAGLHAPIRISDARRIVFARLKESYPKVPWTRADVDDAFDDFLTLSRKYYEAAKRLVNEYYDAKDRGKGAAWKRALRKRRDAFARSPLSLEMDPETSKRLFAEKFRGLFGECMASVYRVAGNAVGGDLGRFLERELMENDFLPGDVRPGNMGMVPSSVGPALIDPGLAVYFGDKRLPGLPELPLT